MLIKGQNAENIRYQDTMKGEAKVNELENKEELTGKEIKKLEEYQNNKVVYDAIIEALNKGISDTVYKNPTDFLPVLTNVLSTATTDKKLIEKISDGLSEMDKTADIQRDKKGNILYDKETKDTEIVKYEESIEDYMSREVLPHIPDAQWFFEENLSAKGNGEGVRAGAGNPVYEDRYSVYYMWEDILKKDTLIEIISKFMFLETKDEEDELTGKIKHKETLIFPRYHQLDVIRKVLEDIRQNLTAQNYLIQHSTGSGKTNSIAWLAHRLTSLHDSENRVIFDNVISCSCCGSLHFDIGHNGIYERGRSAEEDPYLFSGSDHQCHCV